MKNGLLARILSVALVFFSATAHAGGELIKAFDLIAADIVLHPHANIAYASTINDNSVAVINLNTMEQVASIFVGSAPARMGLDPSGSRLYVALSGASSVAVIDTSSNSKLSEIPLPFTPYDVAIGNGNRMYVSPGYTGSYKPLIQVDLLTNTVTTEFGGSEFPYYSALIEISDDRNFLYMANRGLSPGTLAKYDVSGETPVFLFKNPHGDLGSNGQDLHVTRDGKHVYYAVGGGNSGYNIAQLSTASFAVNGVFATGAYPREITTSPDGKTAYAVHTSGHIDVWDATTFLQLPQYNISGEAYELLTDHSGDYLLAATSTQLRVYSAEGSTPLIDLDGDGIDDSVDNCVGLYNPTQADRDSDAIGDECDIFPDEPNHDLAQCRIDLTDSHDLIGYYEDLIEKYEDIMDDDDDGEINRNDLCELTPAGAPVDSDGCSNAQFCARITSASLCVQSDWRNDEPDSPRDCRWVSKSCVDQ